MKPSRYISSVSHNPGKTELLKLISVREFIQKTPLIINCGEKGVKEDKGWTKALLLFISKANK